MRSRLLHVRFVSNALVVLRLTTCCVVLGVDEEQVLSDLPRTVRQQIAVHQYSDFISQQPYFEFLGISEIHKICEIVMLQVRVSGTD